MHYCGTHSARSLNHRGNWYNFILPLRLPEQAYVKKCCCFFCFFFFFYLSLPQFPVFVSLASQKVRAVSYPSSEVTAVWKCGAPRQSAVDWLWLPRETHSPHNNELLRLPEDTASAWRIEIKRQVREVRRRRRRAVAGGRGGEANTGGNEFSIRQMWDASLAGMREEILPRRPNALSKCP